jgi:hypothetical protein
MRKDIHPLPAAEFGYPAEGGAEFVHGEAPVTYGLLREAGLLLLPIHGTQWTGRDGTFSREESQDPHEAELHKALQELKDDLTVGEFLRRHFAGPEYDRPRHSIERIVEGYDAADPERASTLALRDEWMDGGRSKTSSHRRWLWCPPRISDCRVPQPLRCDSSRLSRIRSRHSPAPTARPFSFPAKHSTAGATWALSSQRWQADLRSRGPFWPLISQQMRYCVGKIARSSADLFGPGRTFRAGVADRFENVGDSAVRSGERRKTPPDASTSSRTTHRR